MAQIGSTDHASSRNKTPTGGDDRASAGRHSV